MPDRGGFRPAAFGGGAWHAGGWFVWANRSCAQRPVRNRAAILHKARPEEISYKRRAELFAFDAANHRGRSDGGDGIASEGSCLSDKTNFWIRWRVRVGYPVGIAAFWFARPQLKWLICGVGIAILRPDHSRICRRASSQASAIGDLRPIRLHAQSVISWAAYSLPPDFPWRAIPGSPRFYWRHILRFFIQ